MSDYTIVNLKEVEDQGPNFGLSPHLEARFARVALDAELIGLTYQKLAWCTNWYIRDETLKAATTRLVNFQYRQPLSRSDHFGPVVGPDGQEVRRRAAGLALQVLGGADGPALRPRPPAARRPE